MKTIFDFQSHACVMVEDSFVFDTLLAAPTNQSAADAVRTRLNETPWHVAFEGLLIDLCFLLYLSEPVVRPADFVRLASLPNLCLLNRIREHDVYEQLRSGAHSTVGQPHTCFEVALMLLDRFAIELEEQRKRAPSAALSAMTVLQSADGANENVREEGGEDAESEALRTTQVGGSATGGGSGGALSMDDAAEADVIDPDLEDETGQRREMLKVACRFMEEIGNETLDHAMGTAARDMRDGDELLQKALGGFAWGTNAGDLIKLPIHKRIELARQLSRNPKLVAIIDALGRFEIIADKIKMKKQKTEPLLPTEMTLGDDLRRATPRELVALTSEHKPLRQEARTRWTRKELDIMEPEPDESQIPSGKGSVIVCLDTSGSMSGAPEIQSKALTLAVAQCAFQAQRRFVAIIFSSGHDRPIRIDLDPADTLEVIAGKVIELVSAFYGGGTDFVVPLRTAMTVIREDRFRDADILFVTDGFCAVAESFLRDDYDPLKLEKGFETVALLIDASDSGREAGKQVLATFCDHVIASSNLEHLETQFENAEQVATDVFREIRI